MVNIQPMSSCSRTNEERRSEKVNKGMADYMLHMDKVRVKNSATNCPLAGDCEKRGKMPSGLFQVPESLKSERVSTDLGYKCVGGADTGTADTTLQKPFVS